MANEIYNRTWWGNALHTARTAGTDPSFFGAQMKLLTSEQDNSVYNGDMELDCCWSNYATGTTLNERTTAEVHTGRYSRVYRTSTTTTGGIQSSNFFVGKSTYKLQFWVYPVDRNSQRIAIRDGSGGAWANDYTFTGLILNKWNLCEVEYENTVKGDSAYVAFHSNGQAGTWYIDDVLITQYRADLNRYGDELVTNGSFDTDSDWTFTGGGVSISGGKLNFNATTREAEQSVSVENGKVYRVEYEVTDYSAGSVRVELGSTTGIPRTANGVYVEYLESAGLSKIQIDAVSFFTGSINYIKLTEVLEYVEADKCVSDWTRKRAIDLKL